MKNKLILLFFIFIFFVNYILNKKEHFDDKKIETHIVISSCGDKDNVEQIKKLANSKMNCKFFVYNKCGNIKNSIKLKNVGREFHTFCYHIVKHYNNLPKKIIFIPSALEKHNRKKRFLYLLNNKKIESYCDWGHGQQIINNIPNNWKMTKYNKKKLYPANPQGFRPWYLKHIGKINKNKLRCGNGIFMTSGKLLRKRPINFYKNLIKQLEVDNSPESGHYLERLVSVCFM
jgi:hypothetical protein